MNRQLKINCGNADDIRVLDFSLPFLNRSLGVLVSGGLDSALLYFLIRKLQTPNYKVQPYTIKRNDGSHLYAQPVIDYINQFLEKENQKTKTIDITETNSNLQVSSGINEILKLSEIGRLYVGLIETLPEHSIGFNITKPVNSSIIEYPLKNLNKSHILDLYYKFNLTELIKLTHSCVQPTGKCLVCNRCVERQWAFTVLNKSDEGDL